MGSVVGERFVRGVQVCIEQRLAFMLCGERWRTHAKEGLRLDANGKDNRCAH
jgi:acetyl-CoA carboxylase beta subunit